MMTPPTSINNTYNIEQAFNMLSDDQRERNRQAVRKYRSKNRDKINARHRERMKTDPEYRERRREQSRLAAQRYVEKNRDMINKKRRECYKNDPVAREKKLAYRRQWYADNREREMLKQRKRHHALRTKAIERLGDKCVLCGFDDMRTLQIDHINGGGTAENKAIGQMGVHKRILSMLEEELRQEYQLLCANCNWIKKYEKNENKGEMIEV
jgi:hypothetical protein